MTRDTAAPATIEHRIGPTGQLSVKVADWDLELKAASDDIVRLRDRDGAPLPDGLEMERGTDSLSIRQPNRFGDVGLVLGGPGRARHLIIEVPAQAAVNVQTATGDVAANNLRGEQHLRTASGDLHLDAISGDVTLETVSGDISLQVEGSVALAAKTVSGDVLIGGGRIEQLRLTTTSGDLRLGSELGPGPHSIVTVSGDALLLSNRGLRITAVTVAGDLRSDLPHTSGGSPGRRSLVVGDGATELQFRSVSGDLRVLDPASAVNGGFPVAPLPPDAPPPPLPPDDDEASRLEILRALESGEIDVAEAIERLAGLDGAAG